MNPNLMNPEIVMRSAQEREQELRRRVYELHEDVSRFEHPNPPKIRRSHRLPYLSLDRVFSALAR